MAGKENVLVLGLMSTSLGNSWIVIAIISFRVLANSGTIVRYSSEEFEQTAIVM
jgi:hypothetical protein